MRLIKLLLILAIAGCGVDIGNSSSEDQDNDITTIDNSDHSNTGTGGSDLILCKGVLGIDGSGGFLWKPSSEKDGNLAVLFPESFSEQFLSVVAERPSGSLEEGVFAEFGNGDRQTWRFSMPGGEYTGRLIVDAGTQECEWFVHDPSERQD